MTPLLRAVIQPMVLEGGSYAGIGSRATPDDVCCVFTRCAQFLSKQGMVLRSGGADGADTAFERGAVQKEIFLPGKMFNRNESPLFPPSKAAFDMAAEIHPAWNRCSPWARLLHARNCHQILGQNLDDPVRFVVFWATLDSSGTPRGGTRTAVVLALSKGVPCVTGDPTRGWGILTS